MQRDQFTCQACGSKENTLHVHHRSYVFGNEPWDYPDTNFITLCWECHESEEFSKTDVQDKIRQLLQEGYTYENLSFLITNLFGYKGKFNIEDRIRYGSFCISNDEILEIAKNRIENNTVDF